MELLVKLIQQCLPNSKIDIFGKNSLLASSIPYYTLALLTASVLFLDSPSPWPFLAIIYAGFPILDEVFSLDTTNPNKEESKQLQKNDIFFRITLYAAMILNWGVFIKSCLVFQSLTLSWPSLFNLVGIILALANLETAQFAVSHQVMHKPGKFYRFIATIHMLKSYYMHFTYHHLFKHHQLVATPQDPSTALKGQTVYQFVIRCVRDSWKGVYNDERLAGKTFFTNYAVLSILASLLFALTIILIFGPQSLIIHSIITAGSIFYLEAINYLEHYGLMRKKLQNGQYEKVTILHSWNAPHRFTNYLLFKLQRHSDHHENSSKPFQTLLSLKQSPFLPHGYTLMVLMTLFPKIWFRVIDPLAQAYTAASLQCKQISQDIIHKSLLQTRTFLIKIAIYAFILQIISLLA